MGHGNNQIPFIQDTNNSNHSFQFIEFVKVIDSKFEKYDLEGESRSSHKSECSDLP